MYYDRSDNTRDVDSLYDECQKCKYYHAVFTMKDGSVFDGVIDNVEPDRISVLVGEDVFEQDYENEPEEQRQYYKYGHPRRRFRRFRRRSFPIATLAALSLLPYPYIASPYHYYNYYW